MRSFRCGTCGQLIFFENSVCLRCSSPLGYEPGRRDLLTLVDGPDGSLLPADGSVGGRWRRCANDATAGCNWLVAADEPPGALCRSCRLTSVRPADDDTPAMAAFVTAEAAKRRLLDQLARLGLPIVDRVADPTDGLTFELLSARNHSVTTGHLGGVVTLDLSESDDAYREFVRQQLGEPYRTVLGHLRHEIGHYFWPHLVVAAGRLDEFRARFGDERRDYQQALATHYEGGRPAGDDAWSGLHVSRYATVHPWEDWAETFAHYLHIRDGLETADRFGVVIDEPARSFASGVGSPPIGEDTSVGPLVDRWLGLTVAMNAMSRSIGRDDLYPFVLSTDVVAKLDFVHRAVAATAART
ncbi:MAG: putative zinc-binding metallopeptidase [Actinomycetota bacterium]